MYLGVDGGGTKTSFVLVNKEGELLASHNEKTSYHIEVGMTAASKLIREGVGRVFTKANRSIDDLTFAFFGLPAYGEDSALLDVLDNLPSSIIPKEKFRCDNDMICGWAAALGGEDGINIVAGTGSIAYGENNGLKARCGGWGEIFSDEGSAYWIARNGLEAFTRMSDGRLSKGPLYSLIRREFDLRNDLDVCAAVLSHWNAERGRIAQLSALVYKAATDGDKVANEIFERAAHELALIIDATRQSLDFTSNVAVPVSYTGGVFSAGKMILDPLKSRLMSLSPDYNLVPPKYKPAVGSALYAAKLDGFAFTDQAMKKLKL